MKIVLILPGIGPSGGVRVTTILANALIERGHEVRVLYRKTRQSGRQLFHKIIKKFLYPKSPDWIRKFKGQLEPFKDVTQCDFPTDEIVVGVGMWSSAQLGLLDHLPTPI